MLVTFGVHTPAPLMEVCCVLDQMRICLLLSYSSDISQKCFHDCIGFVQLCGSQILGDEIKVFSIRGKWKYVCILYVCGVCMCMCMCV